MPKGRMLNKKISYDEDVAKLSLEAILLYTWCIPHLDVEGRIHANPHILKGVVVPYIESLTYEKIGECIEEISKNKLVDIYGTVHKYMAFKGFKKNQRIDKEKEAASDIPPPPNTEKLQTNSGVTLRKVKLSKDKLSKVKYAEFVSMTKEEYQKLVIPYGEWFVKKCIEVLDNYKGSKGRTYKSDYRAILSWVVDKVKGMSWGGVSAQQELAKHQKLLARGRRVAQEREKEQSEHITNEKMRQLREMINKVAKEKGEG